MVLTLCVILKTTAFISLHREPALCLFLFFAVPVTMENLNCATCRAEATRFRDEVLGLWLCRDANLALTSSSSFASLASLNMGQVAGAH